MFRRQFMLTVGFLLALGWLDLTPARSPAIRGGENLQFTEPTPGIIKSEANVVLVDVIVTDKKGRYVRDMKQKEFHVFEDGVEQPITSFSCEADVQPGTPDRQRYTVLFFDNAGLDSEGQMWERNAAAKFVERTVSPQRMMAVMDYSEGLHVAQNFTTDRDLLLSAVRMTKFAPTQTVLPGPPAQGERSQSEFASRNLLPALREVARMLGTAPGRKTLVFLSAGLGLTSGRPTDFRDTIIALNKANVGVYTLSASGLAGTGISAENLRRSGESSTPARALPGLGTIPGESNFPGSSTFGDALSTSGGLPQLASQTGGFAIASNNELQVEMEAVSEEMNEYYLLGYVPPNPTHDGRYHIIHVKVDRSSAEVRSRQGYSDLRSPDILAGKAEGITLEAKATSFEAGEIPVTLRTPYFYIRPGIARVNLALSIPGSALDFEKHGDKFGSRLSVLGIAYSDDGSAAARFSDTVNLDYEKDEKLKATTRSFDYQNSFKIAPGQYTFKLVVTAGGGKFGKYVVPLIVDPFSGKQLTLSGPAFGDRCVPSPLSSADIDQGLIEGSAPMAANGMQVVPSSHNRFKNDSHPVVYVEVYDPPLASRNLQIGVLYDIVNRRTNQKMYSSNTLPVSDNLHPGNPLVPLIFSLPMDKLPVGSYSLATWARDSDGNVSAVRTGDFSIE